MIRASCENQGLWCLPRTCIEFNGYYLTHPNKFKKKKKANNQKLQIHYWMKKQNEGEGHTNIIISNGHILFGIYNFP